MQTQPQGKIAVTKRYDDCYFQECIEAIMKQRIEFIHENTDGFPEVISKLEDEREVFYARNDVFLFSLSDIRICGENGQIEFAFTYLIIR